MLPSVAHLPVAERFFRHVDRGPHPRGCWLWTGATNPKGYGIFGWDGETWRAHRASYRLHKGDPGTAKVMHGCDTPACVNPDHLHLGTQRQNMADRKIKGRWAGGRPAALTAEQRSQISRRARMGESLTSIARSLGVARATVQTAKRQAHV